MIRIGIKCEIHQCSLECMKIVLKEYFNKQDIELLELGFRLRNDLQYYPDRLISKEDLEKVRLGAPNFFIKTKVIISKITQKEIQEIRTKIKSFII